MEIKIMDLTSTPFHTVQEAADYMRLRKRTLDNMRWMGTGPAVRKHGGRIFYHAAELQPWSLATEVFSTTER